MSNGTTKRLVIIDEVFEKIEGHYYEYDKSVAELFEQRGYEVVIYGHKNMLPSFVDELGARPWFTINPKAKVRKIPVLGAILYRASFWKKYRREIEQLIAQLPKDKETLLFFPNVYWYNILPIAWALKGVSMRAALLYRVSVYDTIGLPKAMKPVTMSIVTRAVKILARSGNARFFTDSEVIANEWTDETKQPMKVLPIPHLTLNKKDGGPAGKVRMYLPGGMRIEKGAQMLTEAFELLAQQQPELLNRITLVTQFLGGHDVLEGYKQRLAALPVDNVFLKHLTTEAYNNELKAADVILIPYQMAEGYRARTSGILAEAIASSKPFITTDGTWMSLQARRYNTGAVIPDGEPHKLAEAIGDMVADYDKYHSKANTAAGQWLKTQSKEVFYQQMATAMQ